MSVQVQRANVILTIDESQEEHYLAKGFNVIDENGNVVKKTSAKDVKSLEEENANLTKKIAQLEAKLKELEVKSESEPKEVKDEEEFIEKPKRRKNK